MDGIKKKEDPKPKVPKPKKARPPPLEYVQRKVILSFK